MAPQMDDIAGRNVSKEGNDMKSERLFTTADVVKINQRLIKRESAPLAPDIRDRYLRDVRFSREQINSAFAAARRRLNEA